MKLTETAKICPTAELKGEFVARSTTPVQIQIHTASKNLWACDGLVAVTVASEYGFRFSRVDDEMSNHSRQKTRVSDCGAVNVVVLALLREGKSDLIRAVQPRTLVLFATTRETTLVN